MSKNSRFDQMPQDQKDNMLEKQVQYGPKVAFALGVIFTPIFVLLMTLVYWGAFNLFTGAALTFKSAFGIVSHAFVPLIISSLLAIIILLIKPRGDVDPEHFLASGLFAGRRAEVARGVRPIAGVVLDMDNVAGGHRFFRCEPKEN
jgi:Yip1 domain